VSLRRSVELAAGRRYLLALLLLTVALVTPKLRAADEIEYFVYLRSVVFDGNIDFSNEYRHFYDLNPVGLGAKFRGTFLDLPDPVTGLPQNFGPLGTALLWSPFYLLAHAVTSALGASGFDVAADGYSAPYIASVCYASALYGFLGFLLIDDLLQRFAGVSAFAARSTVAAIWLGTPAFFYMTVAPGYSHAVSLFAVALLLWLSLRALARDGGVTTLDAAVLGVVGGLAALVREQDVLFLVVPAMAIAWSGLRRREPLRALLRGVVLGAAAFVTFGPQLLVYKTLYGVYRPSPYVRQKLVYSSPHFFDVLLDPTHSLFLWSPLLLLAVVGIAVAVWRRRDAPSALLAAALLAQVWICGSYTSWSQASAFGMRRFIAASPIFAWGLAELVSRAESRGGTLRAVLPLVACVWWNLSLMIQFGSKMMDRQKPHWPTVAANQVLRVPPLVGRAAYLFFTDRERLVREGL
jgi:hypothetical protein